jgi:hypothetical protein
VVSPIRLYVDSKKSKLRSVLLFLGTLGGSLILNEFSDFVSDELSAFVGASSLTGETHSLLLLNRVSSLEILHHLALERRESCDFHHHFTDGGDAGMDAALAMRLVNLEGIWMLLRLSHDVAFVQTDKNS